VAEPPSLQRPRYPLAAYNFRVTVDGTAMRFAKVSGLQREYQTLTYRHGLSFAEGELLVRYYADRYVPVTLEQGSVAGSHRLHRWLEQKTPSAMAVSLCDAAGTPVLSWRIAKAVPIKLSAPTFDANTNEVAIDSLEIRAAGVSIVPVEGAP
jgi:phage tail-like protein